MKKYVVFIVCLLLILTLVSCAPTAPPVLYYLGILYNTCDGTCNCSGWTLDFYIDGDFAATIEAGQNHSVVLEEGWHTFLVYHNQIVIGDEFSMNIYSDGWYYWYGCVETGTHP